MSKATHFAIRALHLIEPDDYTVPEWDVLALLADGTVRYTEWTFGTEREAVCFRDGFVCGSNTETCGEAHTWDAVKHEFTGKPRWAPVRRRPSL